MSADPVVGVRAKLDRAAEHLDQLKTQMDADGKADLDGFTVPDDLKTGEGVVVHRLPASLSVRYALLAGEVVGQIRSALEHVVGQLVPEPARTRQTGFPVYLKKPADDTTGKAKIDGINPAAAAIIQGLQPFKNGRTDSELPVLHEWWNGAKHRLLNLSGVARLGLPRVYTFPNGLSQLAALHTVEPGDFKDGAELLRVAHPNDYRPPEVKMGVVGALVISGLPARLPASRRPNSSVACLHSARRSSRHLPPGSEHFPSSFTVASS